jgi:hypothetical protein
VHEALAAVRGCVAPVGEGLIHHAVHAFAPGQLQQGKQVRPVGMHAPRPQQAEQVQGTATLQGVLTCAHQCGVLEEGAILYGFIQTGKLLINHEARPHVLVAYLRIAHLPVGQAHRML